MIDLIAWSGWAFAGAFGLGAYFMRKQRNNFKRQLDRIHQFWPHTATLREAPRDE